MHEAVTPDRWCVTKMDLRHLRLEADGARPWRDPEHHRIKTMDRGVFLGFGTWGVQRAFRGDEGSWTIERKGESVLLYILSNT